MRHAIIFAFALFIIGTTEGIACKPAASIVDSACDTLVAYNDTPLEESICATLEDMIAIGNLILGARTVAKFAPDAGPPATTCQLLPHTDVCATDEELYQAIQTLRKVKR
jgi:hypothetical protein